MKRLKYILLFMVCLLVFGCSFNNTPKSEIKKLLNSYQSVDNNIKSEIGSFLDTLGIENSYKEDYQKVYEKQYSDLTYEIKDETIDGDFATVTAQIEVYDYYKVDNDSSSYIASHSDEFNSDGIFDSLKALKYKLDMYDKNTDRVNYTINFTLTKVDDEWLVDSLTEEQLEKLHGTYAH